jgi:manganese-dependent ADP-ribose/CDP-alcohol diphosphatase
MRTRILIFFLGLVLSSSLSGQEKSVRIGILTDCQYCNCDPDGQRMYRLSPGKLDSCIRVFNKLHLDAVFHLGDMIDRSFKSYDSILPRFRLFSAPFYMVLGNHDYMIDKKYKQGLQAYIGLPEPYYTVDLGHWTMIVLNGDDLSFSAPQTKEERKERNTVVTDLYSSAAFNGMLWNGGIGIKQMQWLEDELKKAQLNKKKVIVICHFPLFSRKDHNLFNRWDLFALLDKYSCVKAYFNGHYHRGNYTLKNGIHFVNFIGMVDTKVNAFAVVTLTDDYILIKGYGREPDRRLKVRP